MSCSKELPASLQNTHFNPPLKADVLHQYNECGVTQPKSLNSLKGFGIDILGGDD